MGKPNGLEPFFRNRPMDPYGTWTYFMARGCHDQQMILLLGNSSGHCKDETSAGGFPGFPVPETMTI